MCPRRREPVRRRPQAAAARSPPRAFGGRRRETRRLAWRPVRPDAQRRPPGHGPGVVPAGRRAPPAAGAGSDAAPQTTPARGSRRSSPIWQRSARGRREPRRWQRPGFQRRRPDGGGGRTSRPTVARHRAGGRTLSCPARRGHRSQHGSRWLPLAIRSLAPPGSARGPGLLNLLDDLFWRQRLYSLQSGAAQVARPLLDAAAATAKALQQRRARPEPGLHRHQRPGACHHGGNNPGLVPAWLVQISMMAVLPQTTAGVGVALCRPCRRHARGPAA
mmetsp:Transcript_2342/g.6902  ORF Transcript_2342/g.6902 Transcript_2342/m.6902 type:complete len:275 (-) Transcript_2342:1708-2532(-)